MWETSTITTRTLWYLWRLTRLFSRVATLATSTVVLSSAMTPSTKHTLKLGTSIPTAFIHLLVFLVQLLLVSPGFTEKSRYVHCSLLRAPLTFYVFTAAQAHICPGVVVMCCQCLIAHYLKQVLSKREGFDPCSENYAEVYFNRPEVQQAIHANISGEIPYRWTACRQVLIR